MPERVEIPVVRIATVRLTRCKECPFFFRMTGLCEELNTIIEGYQWDYKVHDDCPLPEEKEGKREG